MTNEFLGVGWKFPVQAVSGKLAMSRYEEDIREAIFIILGTAKGERIMHPEYGCGIHEMVFQTINTATNSLIEMSVREALTLHEPRIEVIKVSISSDDPSEGRLLVDIEYLVISTNNQFNVVYPFFLSEGK